MCLENLFPDFNPSELLETMGLRIWWEISLPVRQWDIQSSAGDSLPWGQERRPVHLWRRQCRGGNGTSQVTSPVPCWWPGCDPARDLFQGTLDHPSPTPGQLSKCTKGSPVPNWIFPTQKSLWDMTEVRGSLWMPRVPNCHLWNSVTQEGKCYLPYQWTRMSQPSALQMWIPESRERPGETIPANRQPSATPQGQH